MKRLRLKSFVSGLIFSFIFFGLAIPAVSGGILSDSKKGMFNFGGLFAFGSPLKDAKIEFIDFYSISRDWIYYISPYDNMIYKISRDGTKRFIVSRDKALECSMVLCGDEIYYINSDDDNRLYRVKIMGNDRKMVLDTPFYNPYEEIFKYNEALFYYDDDNIIHNVKDNMDNIKMPGFEKKLGINAMIYKGLLYKWGDMGIERIIIDSGITEMVLNAGVYPQVEIYNDYIYYVGINDRHLYRIGVNGGGSEMVSRDLFIYPSSEYDMGSFAFFKDRIYYIGFDDDGNSSLFAMDLDGGNKGLIKEKAVDFTIGKRGIYYFDAVDDGKMYKMTFDGKETREIDNGDFTFFISSQDEIIIFGKKSQYDWEPLYGKMFVLNEETGSLFELK